MDCGLASLISAIFSTVSLISWMCAQLPQIYANYISKLAEGISPLFLLLWFCGDFLSFTSCLLSGVVLDFQIYLSLFFLLNDITLCYQFYYYNSAYPRKHLQHMALLDQAPEAFSSEIDSASGSIHIRNKGVHEATGLTPPSGSVSSSFGSAAVAVALNATSVKAMPVGGSDTLNTGNLFVSSIISSANIGLVLAWGCTFVYMASRCPQLLKNYRRKSVEGVSPMLFGSALAGNFTYTLSILSSCEFLYDANRTAYFWRQLPYIMGSAGTIVFDIAYFYQRRLYRDAVSENSVMALESWDSH